MNGSELISPALLSAVAFFVVGLSALMVVVHTGILGLAAQRTSLPSLTKITVPLLAGTLLAAWLGWAVMAESRRVVAPELPPVAGKIVQGPMLLLVMSGMVALGITVLFVSKTMRVINTATPSAWLVGVQVYRVAGVLFLWPFLAGHALPAGFALPAGIGDVLTGIGAPFVALAISRHRPGARAAAVAWNWFGILDLIVAPLAAVLTQSTNVGRFPLVVVPLFLGPPLGILTHIYSLRNLAVNREG
jgi:hypothetical protein